MRGDRMRYGHIEERRGFGAPGRGHCGRASKQGPIGGREIGCEQSSRIKPRGGLERSGHQYCVHIVRIAPAAEPPLAVAPVRHIDTWLESHEVASGRMPGE